MANTVEIIITAQNLASSVLFSISKDVSEAGDQLARMGASLVVASTAIGTSIAIATTAAIGFDQQMVNTASILGQTRDQIQNVGTEILNMGARTTVGAQNAAIAYNTIVGGIQDVTTHMDILDAAIATSEAGLASLTTTTNGVVSVMNSYRFSAEQASFVSDVFTRTVALGVGSMEDFVSQISPLTGIMSSVGIGFDELGASMAYMTTQGFNASLSATSIRSAVTALLNPNAQLIPLLREMGYASGEAAIAELGLTGALQSLNEVADGSQSVLARALGSVEALNAAIVLGTPQVNDFFSTYQSGLVGATDAARSIQLESSAAQLMMLKSAFDAVTISIGQAFLPTIDGLAQFFQPILLGINDFIQANQGLVSIILTVISVFAAVGPVMLLAGQILGSVGAIATALASPFMPLIIIASLIGIAFITNFGGIRDILQESIFPVFAELGTLFTEVFNVLSPLVVALGNLFGEVFGGIMIVLKPFLDLLLFTIRLTTALVQLIAGDLPAATASFNAAITGTRQTAENALQTSQAMNSASLSASNVQTNSQQILANQQSSSQYIPNTGGIPVYLPNNGVSYSDPNAQYAANLASLGITPYRDRGGYGKAGSPVMIGTGAQPELFVPETNGRFYTPNQQGGIGGNSYQVNVEVTERQILTPQEARKNGSDFGQSILRELREGGSIGQL